MSFVHIHFRGKTTTPWHIGRMKYGDYLYARRDYLWGRGIRGAVLRQLWRVYCPKSDVADGVSFKPEKDCVECTVAENCPFNNLRGTADDGEFKDKPRLIITNLRFLNNVRSGRFALATINDQYLAAVPERAPVFVEYVSDDAKFEFEVILMAEGVRFADDFRSAVEVSLRFHGWGGLCNEGFGRGVITNFEKHGFNGFELKYLTPTIEELTETSNPTFTLTIEPMLILDKDGGGFYLSILEDGFKEKFSNCINERFWQFYGGHIFFKEKLEEVTGRARTVKIRGWSRILNKEKPFEGIGNELTLHFTEKLNLDEAKALALTRYGIGRYKNQGFGSLKAKKGET